MKLVSKVALTFFGGAAVAGTLLVACGSDDATSPGFDPNADAAPEAAPILLDGSAPPDTSMHDSSSPRAPFDAAAAEITCSVTPCATRVVAGDRHFCATTKDGLLRCWGDPSVLGDFVDGGDPEAGARPVVITGEHADDLVDIAASSSRTCLAHADGGVECFGSSSPTPTPIVDAGAAVSLAVGDMRSCDATSSGELRCWGTSYQWGMDDAIMPLGGDPAVGAAVDTSCAFALGKSGTVFSWGADLAQLGRNTPYPQDLVPTAVPGVPPAIRLYARNGNTMAITNDGRLFGWGHNNSGALGLGSLAGQHDATEIPFATGAYPSQISVSASHACARMTDGTLWCWGASNRDGELGYESAVGVYVPTPVDGPKNVVSVAVGLFTTCILTADGKVSCWGDNSSGQLGIGVRDADRHVTPTAVIFP